MHTPTAAAAAATANCAIGISVLVPALLLLLASPAAAVPSPAPQYDDGATHLTNAELGKVLSAPGMPSTCDDGVPPRFGCSYDEIESTDTFYTISCGFGGWSQAPMVLPPPYGCDHGFIINGPWPS